METVPGDNDDARFFNQDEAFLEERWKQFLIEYPTQEHCLEEFYRGANIDMTTCRKCRSRDVVLEPGFRKLRCRTCRKKTCLTAGTFLDHSKLPHLWIGAIWLLQNGVLLTASRFMRLTALAYSSANLIFKKATLIAVSQLKPTYPEVTSEHFVPLFGKRSKVTPALKHPMSEETDCTYDWSESDPNNPTYSSSDVHYSSHSGHAKVELNTEQQQVWEHLSREPQSVDLLAEKTGFEPGQLIAIVSMMELSGSVQCLPGAQYIRGNTFKSKAEAGEQNIEISILADYISDYIKHNWIAISRKYLQNVIAASWCVLGRRIANTPTLVQICYRSPAIPNKKILEYITPREVTLWHPEAVAA